MTVDWRLLFDDEHLLVVDKPAGVVVHPAYKNPGGTLLDALPPGSRIVTRLDKLTSGAVVVARSAEMHARLQRALTGYRARKLYLAIVRGVADANGIVDLPLASDPADRRRRIVVEGGAPSVTEFERLGTSESALGPVSLLRCRLVTGRRHQIRAHLAARGWPILGDPTYGEPLEGFPRVALHAWRIAFVHPITNTRVSIEAPLPDDLAALIRALRLCVRCPPP